ncbi:MAG TPA: hypothetical protein VIG08_12905 [Gemmatimonadales bacterium]|jgi:hypothetical protein
MFLGHYGVALAMKRVEPKISLGSLFLAAQLADVLWGCFLLLGWEHVRVVPDPNPLLTLEFIDYPISHGLAGMIGWAAAAAVVYYSWPTRDTTRHWQASALIGLVVLSHYLLDVLVHLPDLPLVGNDSPKLGLGLWNHFGLSVALEIVVLAVGATIYSIRATRRYPVRPLRLAVVLVLLAAVYAAAVYGPPPPGITVIGVGDIVFLLLMTALAAWADKAPSPHELAAHGGR